MTELPIESALPALRVALRDTGNAILQAPPGAGKTTRVPLALLEESWLAGRRIVMLEPRRLAARAAASRMASELGQRVGETVGYRMRLDTSVGPSTRIEVVTEGVLTRMLQSDPALEGVGLVIFDEFHERSLHADLGLALSLQSKSILREDLRLLVMSATLDGQAVATLLERAPIVNSPGRSYPVETHYLTRSPDARIEQSIVPAVRRAIVAAEGDILVFLPGAGEIRRAEKLLAAADLPQSVVVLPLHGNLPQEAQERAISRAKNGERKVVVATSIAETSLTIEGVRIVIDCGLMRVPRFSPRSGMSRLETVRVTRASADQRRGRAGRLGPGICYRLWGEGEHLLPFGTPEILESDLAPLALDLAEWGIADPAELKWLDRPPEGAFAQARELLMQLGAIDGAGTITPRGRRMASLPIHPRLAHMLLEGGAFGLGGTACALAALLGERDIFRSDGGVAAVDLRLRLQGLRELEGGGSDHGYLHGHQLDRTVARRVLNEMRQLRSRLRADARTEDIEACGLLLGFAFPDRIGMARAGLRGKFLLRNGQGGYVPEGEPLADAPFLVAAELDGQRRESRIYLAAPVGLEDLELHFRDQIDEERIIEWDGATGRVRGSLRRRLGALLLSETPLHDIDPEAIAAAVMQGIAIEGLQLLPWDRESRQLQQRIQFMHARDAAWPATDDESLAATLPDWLGPHLSGVRGRSDLQRLSLQSVLLGMLAGDQRGMLDELAPTHLTVPSGSRIPIDYSDPGAPVIAVRLQEMFGHTETPRIMRGAVSLTLHLLSPAGRPVQVTRDLANFWRSTYFEVRKDLKGRYPKHHWPDDPLSAPPTSRAKPRR